MPIVSILVPCYNEQETISLLLEAVYRQTYPLEEIEVIIADGMSNDQTRERISAYCATHPRLHTRVVDNPKRAIPAALNRAIEEAQGEYIIRLDAHSVPTPDYVSRCMQALEEKRGDNVGGVWRIQPGGRGWIARSIAAAAAHPLGVGDALYRLGGQAQAVDTVPFGAYKRQDIIQIGKYDESLLTNEDYELNVRLRQSGGIVWFDPAIQSTYFARTRLSDLARQYWRYGYWKAQMLIRYPATIRWRQALPPLFTASLPSLGLLAIIFPAAGWLLAIELSVYLLVLAAAGAQQMLKKHDLALLIGVPLAIVLMHLSWGYAFLWGLVRPAHKVSNLEA